MQKLRDGSHKPVLDFIFVLWEVKKAKKIFLRRAKGLLFQPLKGRI